MPPVNPSPPQSDSSPAGCLLRLLWMGAGNVVLVLSAAHIATQQTAFPSVADILYGATVLLLILARYLDVVKYHGQTAMGAPASLADWRRYALGVVLGSAGLWLLAHGATYLR